MQYITLNRDISFENGIVDLLLINIDDHSEIIEDKEGIKIKGKISIGGRVKTIEGEREFSEAVDLDIFLTHEEIEERSLLNVSVKDFDYTIDNNSLILNIKVKIEGLKEIETNFLAEEDNEYIQEDVEEELIDDETFEEEILENEKEVYINVDIDVNERQKDVNPMIICEEEQEVKVEKKSLLKSVFSNRKINGEVCWSLHCVKNEKTYEEIAKKYSVDLKKLIEINNNDSLEEGKLIFLPME